MIGCSRRPRLLPQRSRALSPEKGLTLPFASARPGPPGFPKSLIVGPELQLSGGDGKAGILAQLDQLSEASHHSALALEHWVGRHGPQELLEGLALQAQPPLTSDFP